MYPYHPMSFSRFTPADALAVLEMVEHSVVFFAGMIHPLEVTKDETVHKGGAINVAMSGVSPPIRPSTSCHPGNTTLAWHNPKCTCAGLGPSPARAIVRFAPCAILLVCPHLQRIRRSWYEICPYECLGQVSQFRSLCGICTKFFANSYEFGTNFCEFVANMYRLRSAAPMAVASALPLPGVLPPILCLCL